MKFKFTKESLWNPHCPYGVALLFLFGFIYGALVVPNWLETVEFGQVVAGQIVYGARNPWGYEVLKSLTLQSFLPALLLKAGFSIWSLCMISSGIMSGLCFAVVGIFSWIFSRNLFLSFFFPFLFLVIPDRVGHYYPVTYPVFMFCFGNIGLYAMLFVFGLWALGARRSTAFLVGLIPAVHVSYGLATWLGFAFWWACSWKKFKWKPLVPWFVAGCAAVGLFIVAQKLIFPHAPLDLSMPTDVTRQQMIEKGRYLFDLWGSQRTAAGYASHNARVFDSPTPFKELALYLSSELALFFFAFLFFFKKRGLPIIDQKSRDALLLLLGITFIGLAFKTLDEIDRHFTWLLWINDNIPFYLQRLIVGRWLNGNLVVVPILILTTVFCYAWAGRLSAFASVLLILFHVVANKKSLPLPFEVSLRNTALLTLTVTWFAMMYIFFDWKLYAKNSVWGKRFQRWRPQVIKALPKLCLVAFIPFTLATLRNVIQWAPYSGRDPNDVLESALQKPGSIITGPSTKGLMNYNPQLRLKRPFYRINPYSILDLKGWRQEIEVAGAVNREVYCFDVFDPKAPAGLMEITKSCFEQRPKSEWIQLGEKFEARYVLVLNYWKLDLPVVAESPIYRMYEIPLPQKGT